MSAKGLGLEQLFLQLSLDLNLTRENNPRLSSEELSQGMILQLRTASLSCVASTSMYGLLTPLVSDIAAQVQARLVSIILVQ